MTATTEKPHLLVASTIELGGATGRKSHSNYSREVWPLFFEKNSTNPA